MFIQYIFFCLLIQYMFLLKSAAANLIILGGKNSVPNKPKLQTGSKIQSYVIN